MKQLELNATSRRYGALCVRLALVLAIGLAISTIIPQNAGAQNARIHHSIKSYKDQPPAMGRDLWFMLLTNYGQDLGGKYFALYVTSPNATTVHIQLTGGLTKSISVTPFKSAVFNIPLQWESRGSGIVEDAGIHVWSKDADICCYVMCHNAYTSDGFYVFPMIGWGKEYVVAGYASLFEGGGNFVYDLPTQFGVISSTDLTSVHITPTQDIRLETSPGSNCSAIFARKGEQTTVILNRGQVIQCKTTCTQDCDQYDLSGTVITSNNPVGVVCGSQCPNIPCDFPYCDHVCEMVPPVRMWANTYYTVPFFQPPNAPPSHSASTFLVIASKRGQKIYRFDAAAQQNTLYCQLDKYETYWRNDIAEGSKWTSDAPFLLAQYVNSASYPDNQNGEGDPAEVIVPPVEQFTKIAVFQLPVSIGNQSPYTNYVNIIAKTDDRHVLLDGIDVKSRSTQVYIDGKYTGYRLSGLNTGGHKVESDSGAGVYIYGYGYDESYAWTGNFANGTFNDPDTIPPLADTSGQCFAAHVNLSDTVYGFQPEGLESGLFFITVDSSRNMAYILDSSWVEGKPKRLSLYDMFVLDHSKPAILIVSVYDQAGNKTTITSTYKPQFALLSRPLTDFGIGNNTICTIMYDTLTNLGESPLKYQILRLMLGNQGFSIDTTYTQNQLGVGEARLIRICFRSITGNNVSDTLEFNDGCEIQKVALIGSGGNLDFYVTGYNFGTQVRGSTTPHMVEAHNTSLNQPITYDSMYVEDPVHFVPTPTNLQRNYWVSKSADSILRVPPQFGLPVEFSFTTSNSDSLGTYSTKWWAHSTTLPASDAKNGWRSAELKGTIVAPGTKFGDDIDTSVRCVNATNNVVVLKYTIKATGSSMSTITDIVDDSVVPAGFHHHFIVLRQNGTEITKRVDIGEALQQDAELYIYDTVFLPQVTNGTYVDTIWVTELTSDTRQLVGKPVVGKVTAIYSFGQLDRTSIAFPPVKYQGLPPADQTFTFTNTYTVPIQVDGMTEVPGGRYNAAFTLTPDKTLPIVLQPNEAVTWTVHFDPSISFDSTQSVNLIVSTQGCGNFTATASAATTVKGAAGNGFTPGTFSTCDNPIHDVHVSNLQPRDKTDPKEDVIAVITDAQFVGRTTSRPFSFVTNPIGDSIHGYDSIPVQVLFTPSKIPGSTSYADTIMFVLKSSRSIDTVYVPIKDIGATVAFTATVGTGAKKIDDFFTMPLTFDINKNGLAEDLDKRNIKQVRFTIKYNSDLLDMNSDLTKAFSSPGGWTVDPSSVLTQGNSTTLSTLSLVLIPPGGTMTDANAKQLGSLLFHVALTSDSDHTPIQVTKTELIAAGGTTVDCVSLSAVNGEFNAQLLCGDSTLRKVMNGANEIDFIRAATPDPIVGSSVTIGYANRTDAVITLAIYDALGKEVARPVDRLHQSPGAWDVPCDVSNLANGTYTYRLSEGRSVISKQFVIQR